MKKQLLLLAVCALLGMSSARADHVIRHDSPQQAGSTLLTLTVPEESYAVTIPAELPIAYGSGQTPLPLSVTACFLYDGHALAISSAGAQGVLTHASGGHTLPYALTLDGRAFTRAVFTGTGTQTAQVTIAAGDWAKAIPGDYTGRVTFDVAIIDAD